MIIQLKLCNIFQDPEPDEEDEEEKKKKKKEGDKKKEGGGDGKDKDSKDGGPPLGSLGGQIDVDVSASFDARAFGSDYQASDPGETGNRADTSMSLDPKRDRYPIILQDDAIRYVWGPTNLDVHRVKPGMDRWESPKTASA